MYQEYEVLWPALSAASQVTQCSAHPSEQFVAIDIPCL